MNSRERVIAAFNHREPDRVPVFELDINDPVASKILGRKAYTGYGGWYRGPYTARMLQEGRRDELVLNYIKDKLEVFRKLELDMLTVSLNLGADPDIPEEVAPNTWRITDRRTGIWRLYYYGEEGDTYGEVDCSLNHDLPDGLERWTRYLEETEPEVDESETECIRYAVSQAKGEIFLVGHADVPIEPFNTWFLESLVLYPDLVERFLNAAMRHVLHELDVQAELGVDGFWGGVDWAYKGGPMFSPDHFRRVVLPHLRAITDRCHEHGLPYFKHTDGNLGPIEKPFLLESGVDGYHAIEPSAGMDIARLKRVYGAEITLLGNVDCGYTLTRGSREEILRETREVIRAVSPGGGHVLSSSNSIHSGVPVENYLWMLEVARRYGVYPIDVA